MDLRIRGMGTAYGSVQLDGAGMRAPSAKSSELPRALIWHWLPALSGIACSALERGCHAAAAALSHQEVDARQGSAAEDAALAAPTAYYYQILVVAQGSSHMAGEQATATAPQR